MLRLIFALWSISWTPVPTAQGYDLLVWAPGQLVPEVIDVGGRTETREDLPDGATVVVVAYLTEGSCDICQRPPVTYVSYPSQRAVLTPLETAPADCAPPFGADSISVTITGFTATTGRPGSRMNVRFQLASTTPITKVTARLAGVDVATGSGTDVMGLWFATPASGTYPLSVYAENQAGCQRETQSARTVIVP